MTPKSNRTWPAGGSGTAAVCINGFCAAPLMSTASHGGFGAITVSALVTLVFVSVHVVISGTMETYYARFPGNMWNT